MPTASALLDLAESMQASTGASQSSGAPESDAPGRTALVVHAQGEAHVERGTEKTPLSVGAALTEGDTIHTGADATVTLLLEQDQFIYIAPETVFALDTLDSRSGRSTVLLLKSGALISEVQTPLEEEDVYEVHTPSLVMSIRGTIASVSSVDERDSVLLFEGSAAAEFAGSGEAYVVGQGYRLSKSGADIRLEAAAENLLSEFEREFINSRPDTRAEFERSRDEALLDAPQDSTAVSTGSPETTQPTDGTQATTGSGGTSEITLDDAKDLFMASHPNAAITIAKPEGDVYYVEGTEGSMIYKMKFRISDGSVLLDKSIKTGRQ